MHEPALSDGSAGLHAWNVGRTLADREARHAGRDCARGHDEIFVSGKIELIDDAAQQADIDISVRCNQAGSDFDDYAHSLRRRRSKKGMASGQHFYRAVRMGFWQVNA